MYTKLQKPHGTSVKHQALSALLSIALVFGQTAASATAPLNLPDMGNSAETIMSPEEARRLGENFIRQARQSLEIIDDPDINAYVQSLGNQLAAGSLQTSYGFHFFVIKDPSINAFAVPGGYIGIHSGLILATEEEGELASVIAHEIAHVTQHHIERSFEAGNKINIPALAAIITALILAGQNPELGQAALAASVAGSAQASLSFSRAHEQEADRVGIEKMVAAGFDPRHMPRFFERLQKSTRFGDLYAPEFLQTHPVTLNRIADTRNRAETFNNPARPHNVQFLLTQEKLRVMTAPDPIRLIADYDNRLKSNSVRDPLVLHYGYALALTRNQEYDQARKVLRNLTQEDPNRIAFQLALAETELSLQSYPKALAIYKELLKNYPGHDGITKKYATAMIVTGDFKNAVSLLRSHSLAHPDSPQTFHLLAQAQENVGDLAAAHQSLSQYFYLNGYTYLAVEHLNMALRQPKLDPIQAQTLQARVDELKKEILDNNQTPPPNRDDH